jgi:hypothetical protein
MKCLAMDGDAGLRQMLVKRLAALPGISLGILDADEDGHQTVHFLNASPLYVIRSMPPDVLLVPAGSGFAAPVVLCGTKGGPSPLTIVGFLQEGDAAGALPALTSDSPDAQFIDLLARVFPALPQHTSEECGRCGMDCKLLAERIIAGLSIIGECRVLAEGNGVSVISGGRELELSEFPARIVESTVRGLVSAMRGYVEGTGVSVHLGPIRNRPVP